MAGLSIEKRETSRETPSEAPPGEANWPSIVAGKKKNPVGHGRGDPARTK